MNPAVLECATAYQQTFATERGKGADNFHATQSAIAAYRNTMPTFSGYDSICDFIACVTHALNVHILNHPDSSKLLYAAQVALRAIRAQPKLPQGKSN
jgi:hypothetical protein